MLREARRADEAAIAKAVLAGCTIEAEQHADAVRYHLTMPDRRYGGWNPSRANCARHALSLLDKQAAMADSTYTDGRQRII